MSLQAVLIRQAMRLVKKRMTASLDPVVIRGKVEGLTRWIPDPPSTIHYQSVETATVRGSWITPQGCDEQRVVLYFHGGGFIMGSPQTTHKDFLWRFAQAANTRVFALNYRLAPEHPFPAALDDAVSAYRYLLADYSPSQIAFAGDSAGGNLVFATALRVRDEALPLPAALAGLSPWGDMSASGDSTIFNAENDVLLPGREGLLQGAAFYVGQEDLKNPYASPVFGDMSGFPPTLLHVGTQEVLLDDARRIAINLRKAGVEVIIEEWPNMPHVWHAMGSLLPEGKEATQKVGEFLFRQLTRGA